MKKYFRINKTQNGSFNLIRKQILLHEIKKYYPDFNYEQIKILPYDDIVLILQDLSKSSPVEMPLSLWYQIHHTYYYHNSSIVIPKEKRKEYSDLIETYMTFTEFVSTLVHSNNQCSVTVPCSYLENDMLYPICHYSFSNSSLRISLMKVSNGPFIALYSKKKLSTNSKSCLNYSNPIKIPIPQLAKLSDSPYHPKSQTLVIQEDSLEKLQDILMELSLL